MPQNAVAWALRTGWFHVQSDHQKGRNVLDVQILRFTSVFKVNLNRYACMEVYMHGAVHA